MIKVCHRIETDKDCISESRFGRLLFSIAKEWKQSDQGDKIQAARLVKALIDEWKAKYYKKSSPTKTETA